MRLWPASSAACWKLVKVRGATPEASVAAVKPTFAPKNDSRTTWAAPLNVLWPDV